jgi:hypothetical protein
MRKDATIESLKVLTYADAEKQIVVLKDLFGQRLCDFEQQITQLRAVATQLDNDASELAEAPPQPAHLHRTVQADTEGGGSLWVKVRTTVSRVTDLGPVFPSGKVCRL